MSIEETKKVAIDYLTRCDCWPLPEYEPAPKWVESILHSMSQGNMNLNSPVPIDHKEKVVLNYMLPILAALHSMIDNVGAVDFVCRMADDMIEMYQGKGRARTVRKYISSDGRKNMAANAIQDSLNDTEPPENLSTEEKTGMVIKHLIRTMTDETRNPEMMTEAGLKQGAEMLFLQWDQFHGDPRVSHIIGSAPLGSLEMHPYQWAGNSTV